MTTAVSEDPIQRFIAEFGPDFERVFNIDASNISQQGLYFDDITNDFRYQCTLVTSSGEIGLSRDDFALAVDDQSWVDLDEFIDEIAQTIERPYAEVRERLMRCGRGPWSP